MRQKLARIKALGKRARGGGVCVAEVNAIFFVVTMDESITVVCLGPPLVLLILLILFVFMFFNYSTISQHQILLVKNNVI